MTIASDFAPLPGHSPWDSNICIGGALFATFALGFTEGCMTIERRPIPLRFALRFAVANMLPSAVWSSVSARHVALASGFPLSALILDTDVTGSRSRAIGKRLVLAKSVRALRMAMGSYGLAWSLWHWYEETDDSNNNDNEDVKYAESVVRLAPVDSPLSRASRRKHAKHLVTVPIDAGKWKKHNAVDWAKVGVDVELNEERDQEERVKVIEVELSDVDTTVAYARVLKAQASNENDTSLCSVAVLPPYGQPLSTSIMDAFDVCFNPLSAVLTFIASVCLSRGESHVFLVAPQEGDGKSSEAADVGSGNASSSRQRLSTSLLVNGLLYRHGITTHMVEKKLVDEHIKGEAMADHVGDRKSGVVFFVAESLDAGQSIARKLIEQGIFKQEQACFIVDESLNALSEECQAQSALLISTETENDRLATYFSIADVSDQTLQGIRKLLRQGKKPDDIQAALYRAYGTQRVVAPTRLDMFSDLDI